MLLILYHATPHPLSHTHTHTHAHTHMHTHTHTHTHSHTHTGEGVWITWNGMTVANNSLVTLSVVIQRANIALGTNGLYPLVCQGIAGGQWYEPNGVLYPAALPITTPGGYGQLNGSLYRATPSVFPHGVQCCTNTTITLCVGMYTDLRLAASTLFTTSASYTLSVTATCK